MALFGGNGFLGTNWTPLKDATNLVGGVLNMATGTVGGVFNAVTPLVSNVVNSPAGTMAAGVLAGSLTGGTSIAGNLLGGAQVGVQTGPGYTQPATWFQKQIYKVDASGKFILNTDKSKQMNWPRIGMWVGGIVIGGILVHRMVKGRWIWK